MIRCLAAVLLATATMAGGGEYFRFDAKTGPGGRVGTVHGFLFDETHESLRVIDRPKPEAPTNSGQTLGDALASVGAYAGCTGAYSRPDGAPPGLVISDSKPANPLKSGDAALNGILLVWKDRFSIVPAEGIQDRDLVGVTQALQSGPLLVRDKRPAEGLNASTYARRNVIVSSGTGQWAILYVPSSTLDGLAKMLGGKEFPKFQIAHALDLGGGLSSSFWISRSDHALPLYLKEVDPVRSGIAIVGRPPAR